MIYILVSAEVIDGISVEDILPATVFFMYSEKCLRTLKQYNTKTKERAIENEKLQETIKHVTNTQTAGRKRLLFH